MKTRVVLLPTVEEQLRHGDIEAIDPNGVHLDGDLLPIHVEFDLRLPPIGRVQNIRVEDDGLVGDVEILDEQWARRLSDAPHHFSIGGVVERAEEKHVDSLRLVDVGVLFGR